MFRQVLTPVTSSVAVLFFLLFHPANSVAQNAISMELVYFYHYPQPVVVDTFEVSGPDALFIGIPGTGSNFTYGTRIHVRTFYQENNTTWSATFDAPNGALLMPGQYQGAIEFPSSNDSLPSLAVRGGYINCYYPAGTFTVHEAQYNGSVIDRLQISFDETCCYEPSCSHNSFEYLLWGEPPHLRGTVQYSACESADLNNNHRVDIGDLALLLAEFGSQWIHPYSIGNYIDVDVTDLAVLLSQYGRTCEPF